MPYVPLGGSEETHVIFERRFPEHLAELDASEQKALLTKLRTIAAADAPPDSYVYEQIGNIDVIRFSSEGRVYTKVITSVPERNTQYHVIYVLYVEKTTSATPGTWGNSANTPSGNWTR